jgi:ectoine hydroxylase-related dioxygenase (phytanoyl-CoA dioxygenase family)
VIGMRKVDACTMPDFSSGTSGIIKEKINELLFLELLDVIENFFGEPLDYYLEMPDEAYRSIIALAQDELNNREFVRRLAFDQKDKLVEIIGTDSILLQSNLYLRAARPQIKSSRQESIGWHRETFYGVDMISAVNFWVPIKNVTPESTLRYVPESHLIPDDSISTINEDDSSVARFSAGHKIGLLYSPKKIISGVDLTKNEPFSVCPGEVAIFSGQLIHGAATNKTMGIRFSVDFRLISEKNTPTKKAHFASGRPYFEPM